MARKLLFKQPLVQRRDAFAKPSIFALRRSTA